MYSYLPLGGNGAIRLDPGSYTDPLKCSLVAAQLDDDPVYEALSYVWGSAIKCDDLFVGDEHLPITRSLDFALRRLRHDDLTRTLWVDAICIDQSNIPERNAQVRMMSIDLWTSKQRRRVFRGGRKW